MFEIKNNTFVFEYINSDEYLQKILFTNTKKITAKIKENVHDALIKKQYFKLNKNKLNIFLIAYYDFLEDYQDKIYLILIDKNKVIQKEFKI